MKSPKAECILHSDEWWCYMKYLMLLLTGKLIPQRYAHRIMVRTCMCSEENKAVGEEWERQEKSAETLKQIVDAMGGWKSKHSGSSDGLPDGFVPAEVKVLWAARETLSKLLGSAMTVRLGLPFYSAVLSGVKKDFSDLKLEPPGPEVNDKGESRKQEKQRQRRETQEYRNLSKDQKIQRKLALADFPSLQDSREEGTDDTEDTQHVPKKPEVTFKAREFKLTKRNTVPIWRLTSHRRRHFREKALATPKLAPYLQTSDFRHRTRLKRARKTLDDTCLSMKEAAQSSYCNKTKHNDKKMFLKETKSGELVPSKSAPILSGGYCRKCLMPYSPNSNFCERFHWGFLMRYKFGLKIHGWSCCSEKTHYSMLCHEAHVEGGCCTGERHEWRRSPTNKEKVARNICRQKASQAKWIRSR